MYCANNNIICFHFQGEAGRMADLGSMLSVCDPVHLVLVKTDVLGETSLISSHFLEWRPVLAANGGRMSMSLELKGIGNCFFDQQKFLSLH